MRTMIAVTLCIVASVILAQSSAVPNAAEREIRKIPSALLSAWDQADSKTMASLFADDADLVIPSGEVFSGRQAIQAFYQSVFGHGYAGSHAGSQIKRVRVMGATAIVDGSWSITGAKDAVGMPRPSEQGLFTAVLQRQGGKWRVTALREMVAR